MSESQPWSPPERMPRWVWKAAAIFWLGYIASIVTRSVWTSLSALFLLLLVSLFLSLAIEPGVAAGALADDLAPELHRMAGWLGLDTVTVMPSGDLASALRDAVDRYARR